MVRRAQLGDPRCSGMVMNFRTFESKRLGSDVRQAAAKGDFVAVAAMFQCWPVVRKGGGGHEQASALQ